MPLPTPPSSTDPANFAARADAFLGALPDFQVEMNDLEANVEQMKEDTEAAVAAANAAGLANAAANATTATTQAGIATTQAGIATTQANRAESEADRAEQAAADAEAAAGVIPPVSGNGGKFLRVNPGGTGTLWDSANARLVVEYLTSGTSWVAPANLMGGRVQFELVGGGSSGQGSSNAAGGLNGAFGGYSRGLATVNPGTSYPYSIGAGGVSRAGGVGQAGAAGGATSMFGATANGGDAPPNTNITGTSTVLGGTATGGSVNLRGASNISTGATMMQAHIGAAPFGDVSLGLRSGVLSGPPQGYGYGGRGSGPTAANPSDAGGPGLIVLTYLVSV